GEYHPVVCGDCYPMLSGETFHKVVVVAHGVPSLVRGNMGVCISRWSALRLRANHLSGVSRASRSASAHSCTHSGVPCSRCSASAYWTAITLRACSMFMLRLPWCVV